MYLAQKYYLGKLFFTSPNEDRNPPFSWSSEPRESLAAYRAKELPYNFSVILRP